MQLAKGTAVDVHIISFGASSSFPNGGPVYLMMNSTDVVQTTAGTIRLTIERALAHELGHAIAGTLDNGMGGMNNVRINENPIVTHLNPRSLSEFATEPCARHNL